MRESAGTTGSGAVRNPEPIIGFTFQRAYPVDFEIVFPHLVPSRTTAIVEVIIGLFLIVLGLIKNWKSSPMPLWLNRVLDILFGLLILTFGIMYLFLR
jgi:hypothetical protein